MNNTTEVGNNTNFVFLFEGMEALWTLPVEYAIVITVLVLGLPGNALIVAVQYKIKSKTSTDYLVMIMAVYELLGSLVNTVIKILGNNLAVVLALGSDFVCRFPPWFYTLSQFGSSLTLCALAVDRCVKTLSPFSRWYNERLAKIISVFSLLLALAVSFNHLIQQHWDDTMLGCIMLSSDMPILQLMAVIVSILELIQFCILSIAYLLIAIALRRRHLKKLKHRRKSQPQALSDVTTDIGATEATEVITSNMSSAECDQGQTEDNSQSTLGVKSSQKAANEMKSSSKAKSNMLTLEGRTVNKLTALMFYVSLFYVATLSIKWYLTVTSPLALGVGMFKLAYIFPMLNCISNPIMFFTMSSRFRSNVKTLLCPRQMN